MCCAAEEVSPELWPSVQEILTRHVSEARIKARTAEISISTLARGRRAGITYVLDEVDQALVELAVLAKLPDDALTQRSDRSAIGRSDGARGHRRRDVPRGSRVPADGARGDGDALLPERLGDPRSPDRERVTHLDH
jgi:hypothetical protein